MSEEPLEQALLPRVRMVWTFVLITVVAIALGIVRAAEQGEAMAAALTLTLIFLVIYALFSAIFFCCAFFFGSMEQLIEGTQDDVASPFSDGTLPEQIIPPKQVEN